MSGPVRPDQSAADSTQTATVEEARPDTPNGSAPPGTTPAEAPGEATAAEPQREPGSGEAEAGQAEEAEQAEAEEPEGGQAEAEQPEAEEPEAEEPEAEEPEAARPEQAEAEEPEAEQAEAAHPEQAEAAHPEQAEAGQAEEAEQAEAAQPEQAEAAPPEGEQAEGEQAKAPKPKKKPKPKPEGPSVGQIVSRIGASTDQALAYVGNPDPKLSRLPRKVRETLIADLPAVTAAALLGPAALARHLVASAATGRYRDLFALWDLFRAFPDACKPVLAERPAALARAQRHLRTATRIGISGQAERVAEDVSRAEGLIWQWLREVLGEVLPAVGARPAVAATLLRREPDAPVPIPASPTPQWLAEAATARGDEPLPGRLEETLARNVHRMPATVETLRLATRHYPDRVPALVDQVDLDAPDVGAFLAWARDHGAADRLYGRIRDRISAAAARDRAKGLELWHRWMQRGVELPLPEALQTESLEGFDLTRPETAALAARLVARGVELNLQGELELIAARNRQLAEKAYEAMVCADLDVQLPAGLETNPIVKEGTRCPNCFAWTWVRPGHEQRCPRPPAPPKAEEPNPFELAAAEVAQYDRS